MSNNDPVRELLRERGSVAHVIEGGLAGLLESWETLVRTVEEGYTLGLDDYLNDLDVRQLLEDALAVAAVAERKAIVPRLQRADEQMQAQVQPTDVCLWGDEVAEEEGWTARNNWWYFSRPRHGDPDFLAELTEAVGEE
ncbi:MAG: hypothetical protein HYR56_25860 [Acidobacteria bacterium]|nr:hypothetical protein [Acidobacteriota bacterium]MBI3425093.1 hypothetical protein [Acidobacteriota bacterium]